MPASSVQALPALGGRPQASPLPPGPKASRTSRSGRVECTAVPADPADSPGAAPYRVDRSDPLRERSGGAKSIRNLSIAAPSNRPIVPGSPSRSAASITSIESLRFQVGQQAEAQRACVDELCRIGAQLGPQPLDELNARAVVTQQHIAEPEHQRARSREPQPSRRAGTVSVRAAIFRMVPEPGRQCVSSLKGRNLSTRRALCPCGGVHNKSRHCGSLPPCTSYPSAKRC